MTQTAEIGFGVLYIPLVAPEGGESDRAPITDLGADGNQHIHGELWIRFNGRGLPAPGYFGADDVCISTWVEELAIVSAELGASGSGRYVFDECEQGQPA